MGDFADDGEAFWYSHGYEMFENCSYIPTVRPKVIVCKHCKESGFHWKQLHDGKWRLFDKYGIHSCKVKINEKQNSSQSSTPI
jgi:hypothetical protein